MAFPKKGAAPMNDSPELEAGNAKKAAIKRQSAPPHSTSEDHDSYLHQSMPDQGC